MVYVCRLLLFDAGRSPWSTGVPCIYLLHLYWLVDLHDLLVRNSLLFDAGSPPCANGDFEKIILLRVIKRLYHVARWYMATSLPIGHYRRIVSNYRLIGLLAC